MPAKVITRQRGCGEGTTQAFARLVGLHTGRHIYAYTGLIQCGGCGGSVTADEKHQVICPECRFKFASRRRAVCPKCRFPVAKIPKSRFLNEFTARFDLNVVDF